jgi:hypothetical protein
MFHIAEEGDPGYDYRVGVLRSGYSGVPLITSLVLVLLSVMAKNKLATLEIGGKMGDKRSVHLHRTWSILVSFEERAGSYSIGLSNKNTKR